jgi:hypothetical protein
MNDELNPNDLPNQPTDHPPDGRGDALRQAIADLIMEASAPSRAALSDAVDEDSTEVEPGSCPDPGEWLRLAGGEVWQPREDSLMAHAAACDTCATRLRRSLVLLAAEASEEESAELVLLASTSPDWRYRLSARLARTPRRSPKGSRTGWYL